MFTESLSIQREQGNRQVIAECLARLAAVAQPPECAAQLFGATEALLEAAGVPLSPADRADWERHGAPRTAVRVRFRGGLGRGLVVGAESEAWDRI